MTLARGKRSPRAAATVSSAINNILLNGKTPNSGPSFVPSGTPRSRVGTKRTRNKTIKIKKLLPQAKTVEVRKNGTV